MFVPRKSNNYIPCLCYFHKNDPSPEKKRLTVLYFCGIANDLGSIINQIKNMGKFLDMNIIAMEYPGFGMSFGRGVTSKQEILSDAMTVMKFLIDKIHIDHSELVVMGRSMGTGVAVYVCTKMRF